LPTVVVEDGIASYAWAIDNDGRFIKPGIRL